jgi:hypothetical protein
VNLRRDILHAALERYPAPALLHYHERANGIEVERFLTCSVLYDGSEVGRWLTSFCEEAVRMSHADH